MPVPPELERLWQEDSEFETSLGLHSQFQAIPGYLVKHSLKINTTTPNIHIQITNPKSPE